MRSEKIHYFRTILRKKCFSINLNIGAGPPIQQHVSDKCNVSIFADERSDPLIRSNQIHHIHLIPPQICPFLTGGAEDCDRTNSNFSPAGGFVGGGICFGWVSCHPRRPFNNAHWPACPTLEIHDGHKYKYTKMSFWFSKHRRHSTIWGWSGLPTLQSALCTSRRNCGGRGVGEEVEIVVLVLVTKGCWRDYAPEFSPSKIDGGELWCHHNHTGPQPHSCVLTSHSRHYWCCGTDMRTIWDVADNEDNEETEVAKVVDGQPPTCNSDTWDSKSKTGKTAINRGQNWGQTTGTTSHKHRTSPNPAPALFGDCHY